MANPFDPFVYSAPVLYHPAHQERLIIPFDVRQENISQEQHNILNALQVKVEQQINELHPVTPFSFQDFLKTLREAPLLVLENPAEYRVSAIRRVQWWKFAYGKKYGQHFGRDGILVTAEMISAEGDELQASLVPCIAAQPLRSFLNV